MYRFGSRTAALALLAVLGAAPVVASSAEAIWTGKVVHVSADNIKVRNAAGKVESFLIVPRFRKVFGHDASVTRDLKDIHAGDRVRIRYDQHLLGVRHADAIFDDQYPLKKMKT